MPTSFNLLIKIIEIIANLDKPVLKRDPLKGSKPFKGYWYIISLNNSAATYLIVVSDFVIASDDYIAS